MSTTTLLLKSQEAPGSFLTVKHIFYGAQVCAVKKKKRNQAFIYSLNSSMLNMHAEKPFCLCK